MLSKGKNPRAIAGDLRKYWYGNDPKTGGGAEYCMERLMRTELARVQTEAQKQSFERNGFEQYTFHANSGCCDDCQSKDGKHFKVKDMMPGLNAAPLHPNCRCSVSAYEDSAEYEAWLDYLDKGGTTAEWNRSGKAKWLKSHKPLENSENSGIIKILNIGRSVGAAAKNYPVKLPDSRQHTKLAEGQKIEGKTFAGKGTKTEIRERFRLERDYHLPADEWEKVSGVGYVILNGRKVKAELHWYEVDGEIYEMKVKRYYDES